MESAKWWWWWWERGGHFSTKGMKNDRTLMKSLEVGWAPETTVMSQGQMGAGALTKTSG